MKLESFTKDTLAEMPKKPKINYHFVKKVHGTMHRVTYDVWCGKRLQGGSLTGATSHSDDVRCLHCRNSYIESLKEEIRELYKRIDIVQKKWHGSPRRKKEKQNDRFEILEFMEE